MAKAKYTCGPDGYFKTNVWDGTYKDGRKHYIAIRSKKSSADLEKKVAKFKEQVSNRTQIRKSDITFLEYARLWKGVFKDNRENGTRTMYDNIIDKHLSALSSVQLSNIDRIHLQLVLNNAKGKKRTQEQITMTFNQILRSAVSDHLFPSNVAEDIFANTESVNYKAPEKRPLTSEEREAVFKADFEIQDKIFVYILYGCGLRRGEALALTIFDFNFKTNEVNINKSHEFVNGIPQKKTPKTENGYRSVPIPEKILPDIKSYVENLKRRNKIYLFTMRCGQPITKSSYDKKWARIKRQIQAVTDEPINKLTAHVFRHNYCTNLCYQIPRVSIKQIAKLMGDTEKMVLEVYNHILLEKEDAVGAVNDAMNF